MIKYFFLLSAVILTLISYSKEEGGKSSISRTITDTSKVQSEITEIATVPEIKSQVFSLLNTTNLIANYAFWFRDIDNITGAPIITGRMLIKIDYSSSGIDNIDMATSIETAINIIDGTPFTISRVNDLAMTNTTFGYVVDADNAASNLMIDVNTQGIDQTTLQGGVFADKDVFIIYGDADEIYDDNVKTNFDKTFKFNNLRKDTYKVFAYNKDKTNVSGPLTPVFAAIEIGRNEAADVGTITIEEK